MSRIFEFSSYGLLLHDGESALGWQSFILFMVGVLFVVLLFDEMARRAIKEIQRHRGSSFVGRLMRRRSQISAALTRLLSRLRRELMSIALNGVVAGADAAHSVSLLPRSLTEGPK